MEDEARKGDEVQARHRLWPACYRSRMRSFIHALEAGCSQHLSVVLRRRRWSRFDNYRVYDCSAHLNKPYGFRGGPGKVEVRV